MPECQKTERVMTAIILLNWNGADDTLDCLRSLEQAGGDFRVVVADNGSTDDSLERLEAFKASSSLALDILPLGKNWGFAAGNNRAIEFASQYKPDSYMLLNNDTVVEPGFIGVLRNYAAEHTDTKVLGPVICYYADRQRIWSSGGRLVFGSRKADFRGRQLSELPKTDAIPVTFISGCALYADASLLNAEGHLLTEKFFFGEEDYDFALRMRAEGEKMAVLPQSLIYHKVSASAEKVEAAAENSGETASVSKKIGRHYLYYLGRLVAARGWYSKCQFALIKLLSIPGCMKYFQKDGLSRTEAKALVHSLMSDASSREGISYDDFRAMVVNGTYFKR